jgi:signal recognition particle receptor subunit beta
MATIDDSQGVLVVRIVYDGPALSGKTTTLRALGQGVSRSVECPEERDGRTVFFDWMDYVGGMFEGRQIRCQTITVPGQKELGQRRKRLLDSADAVVCVLDTRREELDFGIQWLRDLIPHCRAESPPVGIVLQANKRDARDAVPYMELQSRVSKVAPIAVVETVATTSDGIREGFVFAVRLALDRVRALSAEGRLARGAPAENDSESLLRTLRTVEPIVDRRRASSRPSAPPDSDRWSTWPRLPSEPPPLAVGHEFPDERVFTPDPHMPGGMIWPPVDGRALLHEVASLEITPARTARGEWSGAGSGWRVHSGTNALYSDHDDARRHLVAWAQIHSASAGQLSPGRAVILADAGSGRYRLWQLVRVEAALRELLAQVEETAEPTKVARGLVDVAECLVGARAWFERAKVHLPCTLWTVAAGRSYRPAFIGLMPEASSERPPELRGVSLLERELTPHLRDLRRARVDCADVIRAVVALGHSNARESAARWLAEVVGRID